MIDDEEAIAYLQNYAPVPASADADNFPDLVDRVARKLRRFGPAITQRLLATHWLPRFESPISDDTVQELYEATDAACARFEKEAQAEAAKVARQRHADLQRSLARHRNTEAMRKEERERKADELRMVMETAKCGRRNAYLIMRDGTSNRPLAAKLAKASGTDPQAWLRERGRGREPDLMAYINQRSFAGCELPDFAKRAPDLAGEAGQLKEALHEACLAGYVAQAHFGTLDQFRPVALRLGFEIGAATDLWDTYQLWRLDRIFDWMRARQWG